MANTAAENKVGHTEKVEKRRALGRGLDSLLPGPRAVVPGQSGRDVGKQQVPHFVRDDKPGNRVDGVIQAVAEGGLDTGMGAGGSGPELQAGALPGAGAELRSAGQPGAAVPTYTYPATHAVSQPSMVNSAAPSSDTSTSDTGTAEVGEHQEGVTIFAQAESRVPGNLVMNIELDAIDKNPYQTRYEFDEEALEELANSIRANGVVQPVLVRPAAEAGRYVLILGERRCRASKMAGKTVVPAMVRRVSEQQAAEMTIIENLQREDLNCMEQAEAFRVLSRDFGLTQHQIGERVGMSRVSVASYMRLLKLTQPTMEHVIAGRISFSEARELLKLEDPITIEKAAERAVKEQMKFEQVETMVIRMLGLLEVPGHEPAKKSGARWVDPNVKAAQSDMERMLGVRVRIRDRKGKGKIVIEYHTVDDYERVVGMLRGKA